MTSSPPATVHVGRGGQQCGAAPAPPLDTATAVSDMLIVPRVALALWHDQQINTQLVEDARGAEVRAHRDVSAECSSVANYIPRT